MTVGRLPETVIEMEIYKKFRCESAHYLPNVPPDHQCARLHGHSYQIEVWLKGPVTDRCGWLVDLGDVSRGFKPILDQLDHHNLNEIEGLSNPTSENIARWVWDQLHNALPLLNKVVVHETATSGCVYQGEENHRG